MSHHHLLTLTSRTLYLSCCRKGHWTISRSLPAAHINKSRKLIFQQRASSSKSTNLVLHDDLGKLENFDDTGVDYKALIRKLQREDVLSASSSSAFSTETLCRIPVFVRKFGEQRPFVERCASNWWQLLRDRLQDASPIDLIAAFRFITKVNIESKGKLLQTLTQHSFEQIAIAALAKADLLSTRQYNLLLKSLKDMISSTSPSRVTISLQLVAAVWNSIETHFLCYEFRSRFEGNVEYVGKSVRLAQRLVAETFSHKQPSDEVQRVLTGVGLHLLMKYKFASATKQADYFWNVFNLVEAFVDWHVDVDRLEPLFWELYFANFQIIVGSGIKVNAGLANLMFLQAFFVAVQFDKVEDFQTRIHSFWNRHMMNEVKMMTKDLIESVLSKVDSDCVAIRNRAKALLSAEVIEEMNVWHAIFNLQSSTESNYFRICYQLAELDDVDHIPPVLLACIPAVTLRYNDEVNFVDKCLKGWWTVFEPNIHCVPCMLLIDVVHWLGRINYVTNGKVCNILTWRAVQELVLTSLANYNILTPSRLSYVIRPICKMKWLSNQPISDPRLKNVLGQIIPKFSSLIEQQPYSFNQEAEMISVLCALADLGIDKPADCYLQRFAYFADDCLNVRFSTSDKERVKCFWVAHHAVAAFQWWNFDVDRFKNGFWLLYFTTFERHFSILKNAVIGTEPEIERFCALKLMQALMVALKFNKLNEFQIIKSFWSRSFRTYVHALHVKEIEEIFESIREKFHQKPELLSAVVSKDILDKLESLKK